MHGLVDAAHVDHLHPDSGIAFATAADGEKLTGKAFGDKVVWVPWRRPGFQLGLDIAAIKEANPDAIGCILGGHGITAWGDTSDGRGPSSGSSDARRSTSTHGKPARSGIASPSAARAERRAKAAALAPIIRGLASTTSRKVGHFTDSDVLDFPAPRTRRLAALGTSCPDHFLRTKVKPMVLDLPPSAAR